jgi:hypothetical protein
MWNAWVVSAPRGSEAQVGLVSGYYSTPFRDRQLITFCLITREKYVRRKLRYMLVNSA